MPVQTYLGFVARCAAAATGAAAIATAALAQIPEPADGLVERIVGTWTLAPRGALSSRSGGRVETGRSGFLVFSADGRFAIVLMRATGEAGLVEDVVATGGGTWAVDGDAGKLVIRLDPTAPSADDHHAFELRGDELRPVLPSSAMPGTGNMIWKREGQGGRDPVQEAFPINEGCTTLAAIPGHRVLNRREPPALLDIA
ncbi:MAG: hypothetical protein K5872_21000 [Rhizobiaceae bacterium]|nr:hypothetical protein [Rhizobiaceae bacterium]MCV0408695.1 hypothetical protein [Rhizobiaceae bacterium]